MDCLAIFDHVTIPWERVFVCGDPRKCNALYGETNAVVHMMHQVVVKDVAKSEFLLGLAARCAEVSDSMALPHVRERLAEMIETTGLMGMFAPARPPLDIARNVFPRLYPRLVEIIQLNSSSSLMALPSEADFDSELRPALDRYLAGAGADAHDRVALFRLAWDATCSAFAGGRRSTSGFSSAIRSRWRARWSTTPT
jgi:4-hydroxyphenylacetate 3-monooxygenase